MTTKQLLHDDCELTIDTTELSLLGEASWPFDWAALHTSAVFRGEGVPHGHGETVMIVPGFLGSATSLHDLSDWLTRIGYRPVGPGFNRNVSCPDVLLERMERAIAEAYAREGRRLRLIGHSLGGSLARAAAVRMPGLVAQVITLGSPVRTVQAHVIVAELARMLAALTPSRHHPHEGHQHGDTCACELAEALRMPMPASVKRTAIYSKRDGVVDWRTSIEGDASVDVEIASSHVGMIVNPEAYTAIARALAAVRAR